MRTALIAGASGLVGKECLYKLLESADYTHVVSVGRKKLVIKHHKLTQLISDFSQSNLDFKIPAADDVFCCLGTTIKAAGSRAQFHKVDCDFVLHLANAALATGAKQFMVVSAMGADAGSKIFYNQVKGEMESKLHTVAYRSIHIFRPSLLMGSRGEFRLGEFIAQKLSRVMRILFVGPLAKYKPIDAAIVAKAMVKKALANEKGIHVHENDKILKLG